MMAYDIFHNYGFDTVKKKSLTESFDHAYGAAVKAMDADWKEVQKQYLEGDKSPSSILISLGYVENPADEHQYEKQVGDYTQVFDFYDFDRDDGPVQYYVLDSTGRIPSGWCATKSELQEPADWKNEGCEIQDECAESDKDFMNKSFERRYGMGDDDESYEERGGVLHEAYNNLPGWLTDYLDSREGKSVKRVMTNRGIDLANATYIKGELPRSNRDPVLKDTSRLAIFRLSDGRHEDIYIRGINNPYLYLGDWNYKYANDLPMKTILELATEYGYIDTNDSRNSNRQVRLDRALLRAQGGPRRGVGQYAKTNNIYATREDGTHDWETVIGQEVKWLMTKGEDKSGYPLDPDKYVRMLDNVGLDTYGARLQAYYKKIEAVRSRLIALMTKFEINDANNYNTYGSFNNNVYSDIAEAMGNLGRAIDYYQRVKTSCAQIVKNADSSDPEKLAKSNERISLAFQWEGKNFRDYLKQAADLVSKLEKTTLKPDIESEE